MIAEVATGLSSLKAALDIAKGLNVISDAVALNDAKISLQGAIIEAQGSLLSAQEAQTANLKRIDELETRIMQLDAWEREKERYELKEFPAGPMVYQLKASDQSGEPPHRICPQCYQERHKAILQTVARHSNGEMVDCPRCKLRLTLSEFVAAPIEYPDNYY